MFIINKMPIISHQQTPIRPDPWETNQMPTDQYTLQLYQANSNFSDYIIAMNQHPAPKQNSTTKKKVNRQMINLTVDVGPHYILSKPDSIKSMKSPRIFKRRNKEERHLNKAGQLLRMQSCYPKLGTVKRTNIIPKLSPLSPIREYQKQEGNQNKLRSKSEKSNKFKGLKTQEISKHNINEHFFQTAFHHTSKNTAFKKIQLKHNRTFSQQSCHQSGGKKPSREQQEFTDVSFWKSKMYKEPKFGKQGRIKVKQMVQYKDKWSINLLKKAALTNKQINSNNTQRQGKTLLI